MGPRVSKFTHEYLTHVAQQFELPGPLTSSTLLTNGHIHDTYVVVCQSPTGPRRYILQNINTYVFRRPVEMMDNIHRVTSHLRGKLAATPGGDPVRQTLRIVPAAGGDLCYSRDDGTCWRGLDFIEDARTFDVAQNHQQALEAARAFGRFQKLLLDLPGERLHETIPNFHHTPTRFAALQAAIAADRVNRAADCAADIKFALAREPLANLLAKPLASGHLPERVCHNDTKINNVLFDDQTGKGLCVIDLDTVMPGSVLYDFGDQVRTTAGNFAEDEADHRKVLLDLDYYEALVQGYLEEAGSFLTRMEVEHLASAGQLITFEIGIRFLADHLDGDRYFRIHREGQNLARARTQFAYVADMERKAEAMARVVANHAGAIGAT